MKPATAVVGLLQACADQELFGVGIGGGLWPKQREFLGAADLGGSRVSVWAAGRRSGKSLAMILLGLWSCTLRPELRRFLRRGEVGFGVAISPNLRQSRRLIADARAVVEASPLLRDLLVSDTLDELVFSTGMTFAAFPCSSRGGRGWPIHTLLLDEAAWFVGDETESYQTAQEVWRALSPATAQFQEEARLVVASSPAGPDGFFADLYRKASTGELPEAVAFTAPTWEANPTISEEFLAEQRALDPEAYRAEYGAEFVGGGQAFFDADRIGEAIFDRGELGPREGHGFICGLDPAFAQDTFAACVVGCDPRQSGRLVLAAVRGWKPDRQRKPRSLDDQRLVEDSVLSEVAEFARRYGGACVVDQYKSSGVAGRLSELGCAVRIEPVTATSKTAFFDDLRARLYAGELELFPHPDLVAELRRARARYGANRSQVEIPRQGGSHGDYAMALVLATWHLRHVRPGSGREPAFVRLPPRSRSGLRPGMAL